jgi:uncharacterized protein with FMN-binding domain
MKTLLKIVLSIALIFVIVAAGGIFYITRGLENGSKVKVSTVNPSSLSDGTYSGKYNSGRWTNEVKVTIQDHKIIKIHIVKDVKIPKPEWTKQIFGKVIEKQNTDIDVIAGATITCNAYLKSIENALNK